MDISDCCFWAWQVQVEAVGCAPKNVRRIGLDDPFWQGVALRMPHSVLLDKFVQHVEMFASDIMQAWLVQRQIESCDDSRILLQVDQLMLMEMSLRQRLTVSLLQCAQVSATEDKRVGHVERIYGHLDFIVASSTPTTWLALFIQQVKTVFFFWQNTKQRTNKRKVLGHDGCAG